MDLIPMGFFDDMFDDIHPMKRGGIIDMKCDVYEKDNTYYVEADIPGLKKEEVKVEYNKGYLTITAEKKECCDKKDPEDKKYIRKERRYGKVQRSFYIGDADEEQIKAEFKDGTLRVAIPKKDSEVSKKTITID